MLNEVALLDLGRPGYQVALALCGLQLAVLVAALWARRRARRPDDAPPRAIALRRPRARARAVALPRALEPVLEAPAPPPADAALVALSASCTALERFEGLQAELRARLDQARSALESERSEVAQAVQLMKRAAVDMRLPELLFELYEGLRLRPRKSADAQRDDLAWHRRVGVEPGSVLVFDAASRHTRVDFQLGGQAWRLMGRSFLLRSQGFDELTLFDARGLALVTVRVRLSDERLAVLDASVHAYRPGDWVRTMVACRVAMDERRAWLALDAQYRDLRQMRDDFGLQTEAATPR